MTSFETLVGALERRFDYHSARVVAAEAVAQAGLADRGEWTEEDLARAVAHVEPMGRDLSPVLEALGLVTPAADA